MTLGTSFLQHEIFMKKKYYFILCSVPVLSLDVSLEISFYEFQKRLLLNISSEDKKKLYLFKQYIDINNLLSFWSGREIDWRGNLHAKQLEEALLTDEFLPSFVFDFAKVYEDKSFRLKHFSCLPMRFLNEKIRATNGFLKWYFSEEKKQRLVFSALRCKMLKRDLSYELQYEDKDDFLVKSLLEQSQADTLFLPKEFDTLKKIYEESFDKPLVLEQKLLKYKLKKIEEKEEIQPFFTIDHILAYMAKLIIVEDWFKLDENTGKTIVEGLIER